MNYIEAEVNSVGGAVISDGTLRSDDIVNNFMDALVELDPTYADYLADENRPIVRLAQANRLTDAIQRFGDSFRIGIEVGDFIATLVRNLEEKAPEGTVFGSLEGDGACFGFWSEDLLHVA